MMTTTILLTQTQRTLLENLSENNQATDHEIERVRLLLLPSLNESDRVLRQVKTCANRVPAESEAEVHMDQVRTALRRLLENLNGGKK